MGKFHRILLAVYIIAVAMGILTKAGRGEEREARPNWQIMILISILLKVELVGKSRPTTKSHSKHSPNFELLHVTAQVDKN